MRISKLTSGRNSGRPRKKFRERKRRLRLEPLEDRRLLAADWPAPGHQPDKFLVQFEPGTTPQNLLDGTKIGDEVGFGILEVYVNNPARLREALRYYQDLDGVEFAELDYTLSVDALPNDPYFGSLYGLENNGQNGGVPDADIDASEAWDVTTGSDSVVVAVIDTGIDYTHPDLAANIWTNVDEVPGNGIDDDNNGYIDDVRGWDFVSDDNDPMDDNFHGTHVAGTIGAVGNNGLGVTGVAWNVQLMPLKFLDQNGSGYLSDAIRALDYAADNGAQIANNSWGGGGYSWSLSQAIDRYQASGGLFVAAAGNSGLNNDSQPSYPASYPQDNVVSVAASDRYDQLASFSNYGASSVDLAAPGVSILSTLYGGGYATASGTSMAAPHVSGAAALVWSAHPEYDFLQVKNTLLDNADPILLNQVKHGRLNVGAAVNADSGSDTAGPRVTTADWSGSGNSLDTLRIAFSEAIDAASFDPSDVALTGPAGAIAVGAVQEVAGSGGREFDIRFTTQSAAGEYTAVVGPDIQDLAGNAMNQDGDSQPGELPDDRFVTTASIETVREYAWNGNVALRDAFWWWAGSTTIALDVSDNVTIGDVNVRVDIEHTWDSDLRLILYAPNGSSVTLFNRRGGSGDDILATFDDEATIAIANGSAPFSGSFRPEQALSALDGASTQGRWQLRILDLASGDTGRIHGWSLIVTPQAGSSATSVGITSIARIALGDAPFDASSEWERDRDATLPTDPHGRSTQPLVPRGTWLAERAGIDRRNIDFLLAEKEDWSRRDDAARQLLASLDDEAGWSKEGSDDGLELPE